MTQHAFIFDMDGTVVDNMAFHNRVWLEFLRELGGQPDERTFHERTAGKTNPEILRLFLGEDVDPERLQAYSLEKEMRYRQAYRDHVCAVAGLPAFLERCRSAGIDLALATAAGWENIRFVMERTGLAGYFKVVVSGDEVRLGKPEPEAFLTAAQRVGLPPERCLVFEDSPGGIEAGRRAGMPVVAVATGMSVEQAMAYPGVCLAVPDFTGLEPGHIVAIASNGAVEARAPRPGGG